ncbi:ATP-binding cassette domain-containing protein [Nocardia sp. CA-107356]|uniref:ATP-binding cassette domain-containing protein n=1 Tax=Nocardia sp. CA-107356 TaxID=3239972 RepID=UPI003D8C6D26
MWALLELSPWRIAVAIGWGVLALGSGLGLAALAAWLIARAWEMPPVLDLSVAVVAVRALGISRGLARYLERLATHDVALRAMTMARTTVYRTLAHSDIWMRRAIRGGHSDGAAAATEIFDGSGRRAAVSVDTIGAEGAQECLPVGEADSSCADGAVSVDAFGVGSASAQGVSVSAADSSRAASVDAFGVGSASARGLSVGEADSVRADGASLRRGDLLVRIGSDIDDLGAMVVRVLVPIAVAMVLSVAAIGLLATISVGAAAILAASLAVSGIVAPWLSGWAARTAERTVRVDRAEFTARALTVLDHAGELRIAGKLDAALAAAERAGRRAVAAEDAAAARSAWAAAATPLSIGTSVLGALLVGIASYGQHGGDPGAMTPMALTVLVLLPLSAFEAVAPLPAAAQSLTTARAALHRLSLLAAAESARSTARDPLVRNLFDRIVTGSSMNGRSASPRDPWPGNLSGRAEDGAGGNGRSSGSAPGRERHPSDGPGGDDEAIGDGAARNSLLGKPPERPEGRRIAIVGPSGAGKTTLLMAWAGLFDTPEPGVTFFAEDAHIFGTTVLENLRVARGDLTSEEAEKALCTVGLGEWVASLPNGVDTDLVGGAAAVSGGQRRRILLARALISPARVLLLDEPTEHLEAAAGARLLCDLLDIDSGLVESDRIVVVVTHQLPHEHRADVVLHVGASGQVTTEYSASVRPDERTDSATREIPLPTR